MGSLELTLSGYYLSYLNVEFRGHGERMETDDVEMGAGYTYPLVRTCYITLYDKKAKFIIQGKICRWAQG